MKEYLKSNNESSIGGVEISASHAFGCRERNLLSEGESSNSGEKQRVPRKNNTAKVKSPHLVE